MVRFRKIKKRSIAQEKHIKKVIYVYVSVQCVKYYIKIAMAKETKNKFRFWSNKEKRFIEPYKVKFKKDGSISNSSDIEISQSTGVLDKNGIEIFEGDIITSDNNITHIVRWYNFDNEQGFSIDTDDWSIEIIGNIYIKSITI